MNNLSKLLMSSALCTVCTMVSAQQVNVSGVIKDATGETVIGASVMVNSMWSVRLGLPLSSLILVTKLKRLKLLMV